ncbi:MAG: hypothetical protein EXS37_02990 [Opitutus sp.]|nr:hypothetical protein [Opitutus sp.]
MNPPSTNRLHRLLLTGTLIASASYQRMTTDGYRTNAGMQRDTYYLKYLQPVGRNTMVSVLSSVNRIHFNNPGTVTQRLMDLYGRNFGLLAPQ